MISFDEAMKDARKFVLSPDCKTEVIGYFADGRVDRNTVPEGWYVYDFREDSYGNLYALEDVVVVNHGGTFLTRKPVNLKGDRHCLCGRGGYTFV